MNSADKSPNQNGLGDQTTVLRSALDAYELGEADLALLDTGGTGAAVPAAALSQGALAVLGRPNVGKSTLVNRILGRREAVVQDTPGVTRDRVSYPAEWAGQFFTVVDTGGWEQDSAGIQARVAEQAEIALEMADAAILVVDATVGATDTDQALIDLVRRHGKPALLAANKVDGPGQEADAAGLWSLGMGQPWAVSALHGRGVGDLLDEALTLLAGAGGQAVQDDPAVRRVALVGRPNVGKSSLLNALAGDERAVVHEVAGTTRDPVDELVRLGERTWRFIDTAGIRRRLHRQAGADYYAALRTQAALERCEVAVVLLDASQPVSDQDLRILNLVEQAGRALVVAFNKWDLMDPERRYYLDREVERDLAPWAWAPRVNLSALTKWHVGRLVGVLDQSLASWDQRITTGKLNSFLGALVAAKPHPVRSGKQPRVLFATQASNRPPRIVIFASGFLEAPYRRFIERSLRETFGLTGTPIDLSVRVRQKRR